MKAWTSIMFISRGTNLWKEKSARRKKNITEFFFFFPVSLFSLFEILQSSREKIEWTADRINHSPDCFNKRDQRFSSRLIVFPKIEKILAIKDSRERR